MIVITDSNILFSILYSGTSGNIKPLFEQTNNKIQFIAPDFIFEEIQEHISEIITYTGKSKRVINNRIETILSKIKFYKAEDIPKDTILKAIEIVKDIDIDDTFFVALYIHTHHKIWTGDKKLIKGLKAKGYDICITTSELKNYLYK